jgi:hypothetical protein
MLNDFENSLDGLLAQYGVEKVADQYRQAIPEDARASKTREPAAPLSMSTLPGIKPSDLPEGMGRANGSNSPTPVSTAIGGDMKTAMASVKNFAKAQALEKLGFRNPEHRHYAFGPTDALNVAKLIGFYDAALKSKYASVAPKLRKKKLASDKLVHELLKFASIGAANLGYVRDLLNGVLNHKAELAAAGLISSAALPKMVDMAGGFGYKPNDPAMVSHHLAYSGDGRSGQLGL